MDRLKRVGVIEQHASMEEEAAARAMAELERRLVEQQGRLDQLRSFMEDYSRNVSLNTGGSAGVFALQNYRAFMNRIEIAIDQQASAVDGLMRQYEQARRLWQEKRTHARAIDKLRTRIEIEQTRQQERVEQHETDEFASRASMARELQD